MINLKSLLLIMFGVTIAVDAYLTEDQLLALPQKVNHEKAVHLCHQQGMHLIKIQDEQTNKVIHKFATSRGLGQYWIDGNDRANEGLWLHEDGSKLAWSKWQPGQPDNWNNEDCLHGSFYPNGFWNDVRCDINNAVICYQKKSNTPIDSLTEDHLLALPQKVNHASSFHLCQQQGMHLIKVQDEQTNQVVQRFATIRGIGQYWMDGNDRVNEGQWVYEDGNRMTYSKWQPGQPDNWSNEDCLHGSFYPNGFWNDIRCDINNAVICYRDKVEIDPLIEDQLLALPGKVNQNQAVKLCQEQGMNLVKVQDEKSNILVYNFAVIRGLGQYWMDGNDKLYEGQWTYEDGSNIVYSKWNAGQPDNHNNEDCLHGAFVKNGFWNDIPCNSNNAIICYRDKTAIKIVKIQEKHLVALPKKANYQDAINICKAKGLNLIKVQNEETNQMVLQYAIRMGLGQYWMDGNDMQNEGKWTYNNEEKLSYSKWNPGQPDNYNNEDCLQGLQYPNGFWNDINCSIKNSVICYGDSPTKSEVEIETETEPETKTVTETVSIYLTPEKATYDNAVEYCKNLNLKLIKIVGTELNKLVTEMAVNKDFGSFWIDGNDRKEKGVWVDSNGIQLKYKNFRNEADSEEAHCINGFSFRNELWNVVSCDSKQSVICF